MRILLIALVIIMSTGCSHSLFNNEYDGGTHDLGIIYLGDQPVNEEIKVVCRVSESINFDYTLSAPSPECVKIVETKDRSFKFETLDFGEAVIIMSFEYEGVSYKHVLELVITDKETSMLDRIYVVDFILADD